MSTYIPTIGLEIHAELSTNSKMFCGCLNAPDRSAPNSLICPVCMAHPGTLPVINRHAVEQVLRVGVAIDGTLADFSEFDRKNYFYPDIPKNYQISQYKYPLVQGGCIGDVSITRIHLEEDTARSLHDTEGSNVDFNRAGVPLMELVTDPVIHSAEMAVGFAKELRLLLQYLGASKANLEKGEMRVEVNISLSSDPATMGTKVEIKNLNSFKAVELAIAYEIERQTELLENDGLIVQETRGWNEEKQKTVSQRKKEESHDYRYYPDPDLPKLYLSKIPEFGYASLRKSLPVLPWDLREKYKTEGMKDQTVTLLVGNVELNSLYTEVMALLSDTKEHVLAANYLTSDLLGLINETNYKGRSLEDLNAGEFASLIKLISGNAISSRGAKEVLRVWVLKGGNPKSIAQELNMLQVSDTSELQKVIDTIMSDNVSVVEEYRNGKDASLQYLVGQAMKATRGSANPQLLQELFKKAME